MDVAGGDADAELAVRLLQVRVEPCGPQGGRQPLDEMAVAFGVLAQQVAGGGGLDTLEPTEDGLAGVLVAEVKYLRQVSLVASAEQLRREPQRLAVLIVVRRHRSSQ